ncbi:peptide ABC transporter substrate-binding protein [Bifidobacterium hapali]|uniref:Peptide ABC transporter substrate-binding protein n=1 Tax=Bifidobacterium hapali TaxID=1630172 RepID=A0A261FWP3_9BIFI|nr:ABC transporter substrate-binding protein [Bifidobacterium hapali]OZG63538.1 peptide ABC transporter substrate-binding protein [Bifidobacterium hapali]
MVHTTRDIAKKVFAPIALALSLSLALAGCGNTGTTNNGTAQPSETGAKTTSGTPLKDLKIASASAVSTLSVNQEAGSANYQLAALYQEGLTGVDATGKVVPALAEKWSSDDNKTWVFDLRQNVKLHDGSTLTTDDIIDSINTARDAKLSPGLSVYWPDYVDKVEKTGDNQITITLKTPQTEFPTQVSNVAGLFVTSKKFREEAGSDYGSSKKLIDGTGPYQVTEFDPSSHVTLKKFKDYWGENDGPDTVRVDFITEDSTRLLAFQDGKVDASFNVPVTGVDQWTKNDAKVTAYSDRSYYGLTFDQGVKPFDDIHVRKAFSYALDKASIVKGVLKGYGEVATSIDSPEQLAGWTDNDKDKAAEAVKDLGALDYNIDKAKEELKQSSQASGFTTTLTYPTGYPAVGKASLALAESLKPLGITLDVKEIPLEQWLSEVGNGKQGVAWMIYNPTTPQPNEVTSWLLAAGGAGANPANWKDDEVAAKTDSIGTLSDTTEKLNIVLETTKTALEQDIYSPVYWGKAAVATRKGVGLKNIDTFWLGTNWAADFVEQQ